MSKAKKKFLFTLKNIDTATLEKQYDIYIKTNINKTNHRPKKTTSITQIISSQNRNNQYFSYLDESKHNQDCVVSMQNVLETKLSSIKNIHCFWCRHCFDNKPIGCPIKFVPNLLTKKYHSTITKDEYMITETVSENTVKDSKEYKYTLTKNNYYVTDGIFCSFNCCLAFIEDQHYNPIYKNSKLYLYNIYRQYYPNSTKINKAPDWRLLKIYGGNLGIDDFRYNFNKIQYKSLKQYIHMKPIGWLYKKTVKF